LLLATMAPQDKIAEAIYTYTEQPGG